MDSNLWNIFYPMLALFVWTFLIIAKNVQVRLKAVSAGKLTNEYFELFRGGEPTDEMLKTQNHLRNLTEIPPLFYVIGLAIMAAGKTDAAFVALAWSYVALRICHGLVHLTINKVPLRFLFFALSNVVLAVMWGRLGVIL